MDSRELSESYIEKFVELMQAYCPEPTCQPAGNSEIILESVDGTDFIVRPHITCRRNNPVCGLAGVDLDFLFQLAAADVLEENGMSEDWEVLRRKNKRF